MRTLLFQPNFYDMVEIQACLIVKQDVHQASPIEDDIGEDPGVIVLVGSYSQDLFPHPLPEVNLLVSLSLRHLGFPRSLEAMSPWRIT